MEPTVGRAPIGRTQTGADGTATVTVTGTQVTDAASAPMIEQATAAA